MVGRGPWQLSPDQWFFFKDFGLAVGVAVEPEKLAGVARRALSSTPPRGMFWKLLLKDSGLLLKTTVQIHFA